MRHLIAIPNDEGHFDFMEEHMHEFSFRYKSLVGVEGKVEGGQLTVRLILLGVTVVVLSGGLTNDTASLLGGLVAKVRDALS